MSDGLGLIGEGILRLALEAISELFGYGLKRLWYGVTGRPEQGRLAASQHHYAVSQRRARMAEIKRRRQAIKATRRNRKR